jgi:hypothetical protein
MGFGVSVRALVDLFRQPLVWSYEARSLCNSLRTAVQWKPSCQRRRSSVI